VVGCGCGCGGGFERGKRKRKRKRKERRVRKWEKCGKIGWFAPKEKENE